MTPHLHKWIADPKDRNSPIDVCEWCNIRHSPAKSYSTCEVAVHAWEITTEFTIQQAVSFHGFPNNSRIPIIKRLRQSLPQGVPRGLKFAKEIIDNVMSGAVQTLRVQNPNALAEDLAGYHLIFSWEKKAVLSAHAQRIVDALIKKPDVFEELRAYFSKQPETEK